MKIKIRKSFIDSRRKACKECDDTMPKSIGYDREFYFFKIHDLKAIYESLRNGYHVSIRNQTLHNVLRSIQFCWNYNGYSFDSELTSVKIEMLDAITERKTLLKIPLLTFLAICQNIGYIDKFEFADTSEWGSVWMDTTDPYGSYEPQYREIGIHSFITDWLVDGGMVQIANYYYAERLTEKQEIKLVEAPKNLSKVS